MLRASIIFFFLGILSLALGVYDFAGLSLEVGRLLLFVFLGLSIAGFLASILTGRGSGIHRFFGGATFGAAAGATLASSTLLAAPLSAEGTESFTRKMQDNPVAAADARDDARRDACKAKRKADSE